MSCDIPAAMGAGLSAVIRAGGLALSDNWPWEPVATQQHGPGNEIKDVVLGLTSPRRGIIFQRPLLR